MEIWKDIAGYEGLYQVSNLGRVKSLNYGRTGVEKVLALKRVGYGYYGVNLYASPKHPVTHYIHRLVAQAFIPNPHGYPQVNHQDEDTTNNAVDNLEWCMPKKKFGVRDTNSSCYRKDLESYCSNQRRKNHSDLEKRCRSWTAWFLTYENRSML